MVRRLIVIVAMLGLAAGMTPSPAIVGGTDASPGEYPWMAAIYRRDPAGGLVIGGQFCGGSLVSPTIVVSAKHCILDLVDPVLGALPTDPARVGVHVLLGETNLSGGGGERIRVRAFSFFPDPDSDIAVLQLWEPSVQTPIRWAGEDDAPLYAPGTLATITGWGALSEGGGFPTTLKEAQVPVISDGDCAQIYAGSFNPSTMVCAGYPQGGTDTCQGDSGGPIMVPDGSGELILIGTTWFGDGCARPNAPGVYSETAPADGFLLEHVGA